MAKVVPIGRGKSGSGWTPASSYAIGRSSGPITVDLRSPDLIRIAQILNTEDAELAKEMRTAVTKSAGKLRDAQRQAMLGLSSKAVKASSGKFGNRLTKRRLARATARQGVAGRGSGAKARQAMATSRMTTNLVEASETGKRWVSSKSFATAQRRGQRSRGLRASIAAGVQVSNRIMSKGASVRITSGLGRLPADQHKLPRWMDRGTWRHPLFGMDTYVTQQVSPPGWFTKTAEDMRPEIMHDFATLARSYERALAGRIGTAA